MKRRIFLSSALATPFASSVAFRPSAGYAVELASLTGWRHFEVTTSVTLHNSPGSAELWLPVAQTAEGYQAALDLRWEGNGTVDLVRDARHGAAMLRCTWDDIGAPQQIVAAQLVATRDRRAMPLVPLTSAERDFWTAPTPSVPTDGIVRETAEKITMGRVIQRDRLRAIYDWVVDTTWRNPDTPGCGTGDFSMMLRTGNFGGKCADINGLAVGLARAAGFPARDVYGIRVADSRLFPSLGKNGDISRAQHCRAEVFLDGEGWFPIDPADVRKVVLEGSLLIDSPDVQALRNRLFGSWEMNWVGYNSANDVILPGAGQFQPNFSFLMYPCAFTTTGQPDCLSPDRFKYQISSRELVI